jgi:tRNA modification GTPase
LTSDDTIAAISTPLGEGGLAVIRLSGTRALAIADQVFVPPGGSAFKPSAAPTHTVHYGKITRQGQIIDEVMLTILRAPRTFTREDMIEISGHGGVLCAKLILDTVLEQGARLALPGEFTKRAFLNGRIDLAQAEAVVDLIGSRTKLALIAANEQLSGKLSRRIDQLRDRMLRTLAHIEAHIDFPDEDIAPDTMEQILASLEQCVGTMDELLRTAHEGQVLRRGLRTAIIGRPNVGKSSLLNHLLGRERAIVSPVPGTTRDTIEETADVRGIPVVFVDTAGLRDSDDMIEQEGVRRSQQALARADLILHVLDHSAPLTAADRQQLADSEPRPRILVRNKADLPRQLEIPEPLQTPVVEVSCLTGQGTEQLKDAIKARVWSGEIRNEMLEVIINSRHQDALARARNSAGAAIDALRKAAALDLVAVDLRIAVNAIGEIVGKTSTEDLLDSIFSQFCIGK